MGRTTRGWTVVRTVPATRIYAIATTLEGLSALAVFIVLAHDRIEAIVSPVVAAVLRGAWMSFALSRTQEKIAPPLRIGPGELPPIGSLRTAVFSALAICAAFDAGAVAICLALNQYIEAGFMLGLPIVVWDRLRRAKRTERETGRTLWVTSNLAWTAKDRCRYLVDGT